MLKLTCRAPIQSDALHFSVGKCIFPLILMPHHPSYNVSKSDQTEAASLELCNSSGCCSSLSSSISPLRGRNFDDLVSPLRADHEGTSYLARGKTGGGIFFNGNSRDIWTFEPLIIMVSRKRNLSFSIGNSHDY